MTQDKIDLIRDRLAFIDILTKTKQNYRGQHLATRHISTGENSHPYKHFSALRYYLLLTCFDILGQTENHIDFYNWINSSKHKKERDSVMEKHKKSDVLSNINEIYKEYSSIYGVSKSFTRFIKIKINDKNRERLFDSIRITKNVRSQKGSELERRQVEYEPSIKKKIDFLYLIRNSFTHNGKSLASLGAGYWEGDVFDEDVNIAYHQIFYEVKGDFDYVYSVYNWPKLLVEIIEDALRTTE